MRTEFVSNEISINAAINLSAFISSFKFGPANFPESSAVLLKESLMKIIRINVIVRSLSLSQPLTILEAAALPFRKDRTATRLTSIFP